MQEYSLYNGEVVLKFNPDTHTYTVDEQIVYGVTSVCGVLNKPALMYWAVNMALEYIDQNLKPGMVVDEVNKPLILREAKSAHKKVSSDAASIGTVAHDWLESYIKAVLSKGIIPLPSSPINPEVRRGVNEVMEWIKNNDVKFISSERKVYSKKHQFAGTLDAEAEVNGERSIIDFKTSSGVYPEYFLQTAAYAKALEEETGNIYSQMIIVRIPKSGKEFGYTINRHVETYFKSFLGCLENYQRIMAEKDEKFKETKIKLEVEDGQA